MTHPTPAAWGAGRLAFLFPGQGSQYVGMLDGLRATWPLLDHHLGRLEADWPRRPTGEDALRETENAQPALGLTSLALLRSLADLGLEAAFHAGHSYGELPALCAGGAFDATTLLTLSRERGALMARAGAEAPGAMLALFADGALVSAMLEGAPGRVVLANQNGPAQNVIAGDRAAIEWIEALARQRGVRATRLRTSAAFHSPLMAGIAASWDTCLADLEASGALARPRRGEVWSNVTAAPYESGADVRRLLVRQLTETVRFGEQCERMYERGARIFVEVGAGQVLTGLVGEVLRGRPHLAVALDPRARDPRAHLVEVFAQLATHGVAVRPPELGAPEQGERIAKVAPASRVPELFFESNRQALEMYFTQQARMLEATSAGEILPLVLEHNRRLLADFLATQELGLGRALGLAPAAAPSPIAPVAEASVAPADAASGPADVETWLRGKLAALTGLPVESITRATSFEGDLGLDSITTVELFAGLLETRPELEALGDALHFRTVGEALARIEEALGKAEATAVAPTLVDGLRAIIRQLPGMERSEVDAADDLGTVLGLDCFALDAFHAAVCERWPQARVAGRELLNARTLADLAALLEQFGATTEAPDPGGIERLGLARRPLPPGATAAPARVLLVGLPGERLERLERALVASGSEVARLAVSGAGFRLPDGRVIRPAAWQELATALPEAFGAATRAVVFAATGEPGSLELDAGAWSREVDRSTTAMFVLAKALGAAGAPARLAVITDRAARPALAGARGVARVLRQEWPGTRVRVLHLGQDTPSPRALAEALWREGVAGEVVLEGDRAFEEGLAPLALPAEPRPLALEPGATVLLLGGGDGITAEAGLHLAGRYRCRIAAIGRTPMPAERPFDEVADDAEVQRLILAEASRGLSLPAVQERRRLVARQRALFRTRERIEAAGGSFWYRSADATCPAELGRAIAELRAEHGPLRGVVHGIGITEDAVVGKKTVESFQRVLRAKTESAFHLYQLVRDEPLAFAMLFSSVSAHAGPPGQSDYAAGNEVLRALAEEWNRKVAYPVRALLWSVWTETGLAAASLRTRMERQGLPGIGNQLGARLFGDELTAPKAQAFALLAPRATLEAALGRPVDLAPAAGDEAVCA
jgi:malonyl CoA-acyl carrier protein transacylase/acyl carrier protein